jgi:hypothetical protein
MWFQFFSWILWIYKNYLCLILITYMQFKFKLVTCNKSFFIFGVKFCHSNSLTLTKRLHNPFYNCNLNSNSLKNWNSHTQMQPATGKYNISNGWDNHMVYLFFSCIASQKIRRHLSCKLKHAIAGTWVASWSMQLQLMTPSRILKEKHFKKNTAPSKISNVVFLCCNTHQAEVRHVPNNNNIHTWNVIHTWSFHGLSF